MVNWKQRVGAGIVLLAAVAAILTVGYSLGKDHNDALVNFLREKNQALEAGEKTLRAEVEALKLELKQSRQPESSSAGTKDSQITELEKSVNKLREQASGL